MGGASLSGGGGEDSPHSFLPNMEGETGRNKTEILVLATL